MGCFVVAASLCRAAIGCRFTGTATPGHGGQLRHDYKTTPAKPQR